MKKIINVLVVLIISIPMFAQTEYYYFKGQRIPLTVNPKKVNIISMAIGPQFAPAVNPNALPAGLEVEAVIPGNPYNMCVIENKTSNIALLHNYLNYIVNPNYNIVLPCYYDHNGKELFTTNKIYIELKNSTDFIKLQSVISVYNLLIIRQNKYMPLWYTVSITKQTPYNTIQMANILYELGYFLSVEPEFRFNAKESISWDTYVGEQWGLYNATDNAIDINASSAWNYATGRGVKVAIVDSGMDWNHEDLKDNIGKKYYDTLVCDSVRCVYETHGTSVSGIILSSRNNGKYISGISPDVEPIIISSILDYVSPEELANGINWACENDADIINCSWNTTYSKPILCALEKAIYKGRKGKGCIVVKSAGNSNSGLSFPADSIPELLVVGAIKRNGLRYLKNDSVGSSYGKNLDDLDGPAKIAFDTRTNEILFSKYRILGGDNMKYGIYYSDDLGATWKELCELPFNGELTDFAQYGSKIYCISSECEICEIDLEKTDVGVSEVITNDAIRMRFGENQISWQSEKTISRVEVISTDGIILAQQQTDSPQGEMTFSDELTGVAVVAFHTADGQRITRKINL